MSKIKKLTREQYMEAIRKKANVRAVESEEYYMIKILQPGEALEITCDTVTEYKKIVNRCTTIKKYMSENGISIRIIQDSANNIIFVKREEK